MTRTLKAPRPRQSYTGGPVQQPQAMCLCAYLDSHGARACVRASQCLHACACVRNVCAVCLSQAGYLCVCVRVYACAVCVSVFVHLLHLHGVCVSVSVSISVSVCLCRHFVTIWPLVSSGPTGDASVEATRSSDYFTAAPFRIQCSSDCISWGGGQRSLPPSTV